MGLRVWPHVFDVFRDATLTETSGAVGRTTARLQRCRFTRPEDRRGGQPFVFGNCLSSEDRKNHRAVDS